MFDLPKLCLYIITYLCRFKIVYLSLFSAEELDDFSGNNEMDDPDDATYLPSDWEISINM